MDPRYPLPTQAEWQAIDFDGIFNSAPDRTTESYNEQLQQHLKEAKAKEDEARIRPLALAFILTSPFIELNGTRPQFKPIMEFKGGGRTALFEDLTDGQLDLLASFVEETQDPEFRARMADAIWSRRPREQTAKIAAEAYLASARRLEAESWSWKCRMARGMQIAASIKRDRTTLESFVAYGQEVLDQVASGEGLALFDDVIELFLDYKQGDVHRQLALLEKRGAEVASARGFTEAIHLFGLAQRCAKRAGDAAALKRCIAGEAEAQVSYAEAFDNGDSHGALVAASWYGEAIQTYRKAAKEPDFAKRIEELHQRMLASQARGVDGLAQIQTQVKIPEAMTELVEKTKGLEWPDALLHLLSNCHIPSKGQLENQVREQIDRFPLLHLFPKTSLKEGGKTDVQATPITPGEPPSEERW